MTIKAGNRKPISRDDVIVVVGEPSSGTRLIRRLIDASPDLDAVHDAYHGRRKWKTGRVVLVERNPEARQKSVDARWPGGIDEFEFPTLDELKEDYPDAPIVNFDMVIKYPEGVIFEIARYFGVPTWGFDEEIYDANSEEGTRETYDQAVERKRKLLEKAGKL